MERKSRESKRKGGKRENGNTKYRSSEAGGIIKERGEREEKDSKGEGEKKRDRR